eukprot:scaffold28647_cov23-Tisochrysis_lutea.AAC.2
MLQLALSYLIRCALTGCINPCATKIWQLKISQKLFRWQDGSCTALFTAEMSLDVIRLLKAPLFVAY